MKTAADLYQERLDAGMPEKKAYRLYRAELAASKTIKAGKRAGRRIRKEWDALNSISGLGDQVIIAPGLMRPGKLPTEPLSPRETSPEVEVESMPSGGGRWSWLGVGFLLGGAAMHTYMGRK
jgi:hypothetical protein